MRRAADDADEQRQIVGEDQRIQRVNPEVDDWGQDFRRVVRLMKLP